jgi:hypothetical protein
MVSPLSDKIPDAAATLNRLREAIRADNWNSAEALSRDLANCPLPHGAGALSEYLGALKQTVTQAKASRSLLLAARTRVHAAARFQMNRHYSADAANFCRGADHSGPSASST